MNVLLLLGGRHDAAAALEKLWAQHAEKRSLEKHIEDVMCKGVLAIRGRRTAILFRDENGAPIGSEDEDVLQFVARAREKIKAAGGYAFSIDLSEFYARDKLGHWDASMSDSDEEKDSLSSSEDGLARLCSNRDQSGRLIKDGRFHILSYLCPDCEKINNHIPTVIIKVGVNEMPIFSDDAASPNFICCGCRVVHRLNREDCQRCNGSTWKAYKTKGLFDHAIVCTHCDELTSSSLKPKWWGGWGI